MDADSRRRPHATAPAAGRLVPAGAAACGAGIGGTEATERGPLTKPL
jgi:hypothetical protein